MSSWGMQPAEKFVCFFLSWTAVLYISYFKQICKKITITAKIQMADQFYMMSAMKIIILNDPPELVYGGSGSAKSTVINKSTEIWKPNSIYRNRMLCSLRKYSIFTGCKGVIFGNDIWQRYCMLTTHKMVLMGLYFCFSIGFDTVIHFERVRS